MTTKAKTETAIVPAVQPGRSVLMSLAQRYNTDSGKLLDTLKNTVFKGATNEQLMALCIVADQYKLSPFTKELYAFPDTKTGGIIPVVSIDGWLRMINDHDQYDGMEVQQDAESCTVTIHRKDRNHPTTATEYMEECRRKTGPWESHPMRMLRHKAIIQCGRIAFGFSVKDPDEAERIIEAESTDREFIPMPTPRKAAAALPQAEAKAEPEPETPAQPAPVDIAQPTREDLIAAIGKMLEAAKASKVDKAMKSCGIAWQDGEAWEQASDETLVTLASLLK